MASVGEALGHRARAAVAIALFIIIITNSLHRLFVPTRPPAQTANFINGFGQGSVMMGGFSALYIFM